MHQRVVDARLTRVSSYVDEYALSQLKLGNCSNQSAMMKKLYHLAEVPSMATTPSIYRENAVRLQQQQQYKSDTLEMNKGPFVKPKSNKSLKKTAAAVTSSPAVDDHPSRLNQFSWEEIEGRHVPVIFRYFHSRATRTTQKRTKKDLASASDGQEQSLHLCDFRKEKNGYQRYTSKMYVEHTLFQSASWQRHIILARSLPPLLSYTYTDSELKLVRFIVEWHLAGVQFKTIPSSDCLLRFEELLSFYQTLRQLRENISSTSIAPQDSAPARRSSPDLQRRVSSTSGDSSLPARIPLVAPSHPVPPPARSTPDKKQSGWIQINHIFLPYIVKSSNTQHEQNMRDREYYVPYEILVKCHILSSNEYPWKNTLIRASQTDFDLLNHLITDINIFDEKVPEKTLLVNLYHVMIGIDRLFYVKFLPNKQPRSQVNKYHSEVLKLQGGTLMIRPNQLVPYILQNNRFYVPLYYTCQSLPNLLIQARRSARAPRQYEVDYLNLALLYFSIETSPFTSDTLLVDISSVKCSGLPSSIHFRTLPEHQQCEKKRLFSAVPPAPKPTKSAGQNGEGRVVSLERVFLAGSSTPKATKHPLGQVMINPLIHHPSFYGLTSSGAPLPLQQMRAVSSPAKPSAVAEIKTVMFHQYSFNALVRSADLPVHRWKISLREICQRFSPSVDYQRFLQWCQTNSLVPLLQLDDDERKMFPTNDGQDFYIYHKHFDRCLDLLNDLQRGSISMTLLPSSSSPATEKLALAGAKKRKHPQSTPRHQSPVRSDEHVQPSPKPASPIIPPVVDEFYNEDDDKMPVVVTVEEEQTIDEIDPIPPELRLVIAETNNGDEERIRFDDTISACAIEPVVEVVPAPKPEETAVLPEEPVPDPPVKQQKAIRLKKTRARSRSSTSPRCKKQRSTENLSPTVKIITMDRIEHHLRTLSTPCEEKLLAQSKSVKTPTRLLEEIPSSDINSSLCPVPSPSRTVDTHPDPESVDEEHPSCTYNVMISNASNKLGLTIKKVLPQ